MIDLVRAIAGLMLVVFVILPALWAIACTPGRREEREMERRFCQQHMTQLRRRQLDRVLEESDREC